MTKQMYTIFLAFLLGLCSCEPSIDHPLANDNADNNAPPPQSSDFFYGADLSYVNEMEDCGAVYNNVSGVQEDVYQIFEEAGANLARFRLWHNPTWTNYSNLQDVKQSIQRAKSKNMTVLLDFHYSDTWADPGNQEIPAAWLPQINNTNVLGQLLYDYTYDTLNELNSEGLLPDIVQIGNETNGNILTQGDPFPLDWSRNSTLLNTAIQAVRDLSNAINTDIEVMLHIAQPENGLWWFEQAAQNGVTDFDWIGLSYYPQFSNFTLDNIENPLTELINTYDKKLMIVETAYPFTLNNVDNASNNLNAGSILPNFPATQQGQLDFLITLTEKIKSAGGSGVVYWEPAWVSTGCSTLWATGSHWDNATLFDNNGNPTLGLNFYNNN
ncbi:MAG: glycosyl hydrolase 53 family protein [Bacteroidota bacterium]